MATECPSAADLERFALDAEADVALRSHVGRCLDCGRRVDEIRENQRFLDHAAPVLAEELAARAELTEQPTTPAAGDAAPGYELLDEVARGGQGVVYRAVQAATRRPAAVKVLLSGALASPRQRRRFEREVEIAASLRHPNLVSVFGSGETVAGRPFVAMEYVDGVPIDVYARERMGDPQRGGRARVDAVLRLVRSVAGAVGHAHAAGVIHRDIKPSNILVESDGTPRVLDFGLARDAESAPDVTMTQEFVGTPAYSSPEQLEGDGARVGTRTDVYALGLVLYRLLTGGHPYPCDGSFLEVAAHACRTEAAPLSRRVKRVPGDVETIVLKCLAKDPERRYENAAALASDIDDYLQGRPISARRDSTAYVLRKLALRHRTATIAGVLVLLTAVAAAVSLGVLAGNLDRTRRDAEERLVASEILWARLSVESGDVERAEEVLWKQAPGNGPMPARIRWALREFYARHPCVHRLPMERMAAGVGIQSDGTFWAVNSAGARYDWSEDGTPLGVTPAFEEGWDVPLLNTDSAARVALAQSSGHKRLVEIGTGKVLGGPLESSPQQVMRFARDAGFIAMIEPFTEGPLRIFDASLRHLATFEDRASDAAFIRESDGTASVLVAGWVGAEPSLIVRRAPDWIVTRVMPMPGGHRRVVGMNFCRVYAAESGEYAVVSVNSELFLVPLREDSRAAMAGDARHSVTCIASGAGFIAAGTVTGGVALLRESDLSTARVFPGDPPVSCLAINSDRGLLIVGGDSGCARVLETGAQRWLTAVPASDTTHPGVAVSVDGAIAWIDSFGGLFIREPDARVTTIAAHGDVVTAVDFSPDGQEVLTGSVDGSVRAWRRDGAPVRTYATGLQHVWCASYSPDGRYVAACGAHGMVRLWSANAERETAIELGSRLRLPKLAFSADGRRLAVLPTRGECGVFDTSTGERVCSIPGQDATSRAVAFSPDGATIATGSDDRCVYLWDAHTGSLKRRITGLASGPYTLRFHPAEKALFAGGPGGSVIVLDPEAGEELAVLNVHELDVFAIAFSPDGATLVSAGQDPWIGITDLAYLDRYIRGNEQYWRRRHAALSDGDEPPR